MPLDTDQPTTASYIPPWGFGPEGCTSAGIPRPSWNPSFSDLIFRHVFEAIFKPCWCVLGPDFGSFWRNFVIRQPPITQAAEFSHVPTDVCQLALVPYLSCCSLRQVLLTQAADSYRVPTDATVSLGRSSLPRLSVVFPILLFP